MPGARAGPTRSGVVDSPLRTAPAPQPPSCAWRRPDSGFAVGLSGAGRRAAARAARNPGRRSAGAPGIGGLAVPGSRRGQGPAAQAKLSHALRGARLRTARGRRRPLRPHGPLLTFPSPALLRAPTSCPQKFPSPARRARWARAARAEASGAWLPRSSPPAGTASSPRPGAR